MLKDIFRFLKFLRPHTGYVAGVSAALAGCILLELIRPLLLLVFINEVVLKTNLNLLLVLVGTWISVSAAEEYLYGVSLYHRERLSELVLADVRRILFRNVLNQPPAFFESHTAGKLTALSVNEVDALRTIVYALIFGVETVFTILLLVGLGFLIDPRLALLFLLPPLAFGVLLLFDRRMRKSNRTALEWQQKLVSFLKMRFSHALTVQLFEQERAEGRRAADLTGALAESRARTELWAEVPMRFFDFFRLAVLGLILLLGGKRLIQDGSITLGAVCALLEYGMLLFREWNDLFAYLVRGRLAMVALRRVLRTNDASNASDKENAGAALPSARGRLEFQDVSFRYGPETPWALSDVSFTVEPGEFVAVVGLSGSGKSTLFRLLLRFYASTRGAIRLDDHDIGAVNLRSLRRQFALATQEAVLFDTTVADNIRYGRRDATADEVARAAEVAGALEFVERLPRGFESAVGEGAGDLSVGQRHRIALARVVLKNAPILLLDEVTAGLDAKTEDEVQTALDRIRRGRTTLVIAHRLSSTIRADKILVFDHGRLVQQGTHDQLYREESGLYRVLFDRQFRTVIEKVGGRESKQDTSRIRMRAAGVA